LLLPFYAQIFYPQPCQARWLLLILVTYLDGTLFKSLSGCLAIMTDSLDMSVFGMVQPEEGGTTLHRNVRNYTPIDIASLPRRIESSSALFSARFSEKLLMFVPHTLSLQPNFTYFILTCKSVPHFWFFWLLFLFCNFCPIMFHPTGIIADCVLWNMGFKILLHS
jgi:hypothetical protein